MRRLILLVVLLLLSVVAASGVSAQGDPNACLTGGSMEGKCDLPTAAEDEWAWTCGYYVGLYDNGELSRDGIPDWCYYPGIEVAAGSLCAFYIEVDLALIGPLNTFNNTAFYESSDGSCSGDPLAYGTIVQASSGLEAESICESINVIHIGAIALPPLFGMSNLWGCVFGV